MGHGAPEEAASHFQLPDKRGLKPRGIVLIIKQDQSTRLADKTREVRSRKCFSGNHNIILTRGVQREFVFPFVKSNNLRRLQITCLHILPALRTSHQQRSFTLFLPVCRSVSLNYSTQGKSLSSCLRPARQVCRRRACMDVSVWRADRRSRLRRRRQTAVRAAQGGRRFSAPALRPARSRPARA